MDERGVAGCHCAIPTVSGYHFGSESMMSGRK